MLSVQRPQQQGGSSLVEVLVVMLVFTVGLLGLVTVLASALRATDEARLRTDAALLAHALIAGLWTTAAADVNTRFADGGTALRAWQDQVSARLPAATASLELAEAGGSRASRSARVTITWRRPGSTEQHRYVTAAQIGRGS
jgi:type IV pilus assembly protein PilV